MESQLYDELDGNAGPILGLAEPAARRREGIRKRLSTYDGLAETVSAQNEEVGTIL
jgi:hypothetical protein